MSSAEAPESWNNSEGVGPICSEEAYVWMTHLDMPQVELTSLEALLSADERLRAERLRFVLDRQRFIAGRAILRLLLAPLLQAAPSDLRFHYGPSGKPFLDPRRNPEDLRFNSTHANGLALYGVTWGREIGIDLEYQTRDLNYLGIADHFFSLPEKRVLRALPVDDRLPAFYDYWTRKEAYLKGIGSGLGIPLDQFSVALGTAKPVRTGRGEAAGETGNGDTPDEDKRWVTSSWRVYEIAAPPDYCAALAVEGKIRRVHQWEVACRDRALVTI